MESLTGQLLIASPSLRAAEFEASIVLMVQHDEDGALGVVINRPLETTIDEAWEQVSEVACPRADALHYGGPCEGPLMVVHTDPTYSEIAVSDGIHFCTDKEHIEWLVQYDQAPMKFVVGYAGWAPGQLEQELAQGAWLTLRATEQRVFGGDAPGWDQMFRQASQSSGILKDVNPRIIPIDPTMN
jgi:putative transcriptional regulator